MDGWIDGKNILSVVFLKEFMVYCNHSLPALLSSVLFLFFFSSLSNFLNFSLLLSFSLLSVPILLRTVLRHPIPALARQRAGPRFQRPRPQSCDADLLCFTRLQCSEGASRGKGLCSPAAGNKAQLGREKRSVCVCV